ENVEAVRKGCENLRRHVENVTKFGVPPVVAINRFVTDTEAEIAAVQEVARSLGTEAILCEHWGRGGEGIEELAHRVVEIADSGKADFKPLYPDDMTLWNKVRTIATELYGASDITADSAVRNRFKELQDGGYGHFPICMAKTQ